MGHLYAANVLGAALGTLASAFVLIEMLGLRGTLSVGAGLNALLAVASLGLSLRASADRPRRAGGSSAGTADAATLAALFGTGSRAWPWRSSGCASSRPSSATSSTRSPSSWPRTCWPRSPGRSCIARAAARFRPRAARRGLDGRGLASMLPAVAADPRLPGVTRFDGADGAAPRLDRRRGPGRRPLSALLGFVTPWLVDRWSGGSSRRAGTAWALNGLGCVVGPLAGGFLLLPLVGERSALFVLVAGRWWRSACERAAVGRRRRWRSRRVAAAALLAATRGEESRYPDARVPARLHGDGHRHRPQGRDAGCSSTAST